MTTDPDPRPRWMQRIGLEIRLPSRQTTIGFVVAWLWVAAIVMLTVWLRGIGS
jgi:hypothetical protein